MRSLRKRGGWLALLAALALVAAACSSDDTADTTATTAGGTATTTTTVAGGGGDGDGDGDGGGDIGGTFQTALVADLTTDNFWAYLDTESSVHNGYVLGQSHPALYTLSVPDFLNIPVLAAGDAPAAAADGAGFSATIPLREGMNWSDGEPVDANDFVFTFDVVREFELGSNWLSNTPEQVTSVEALDDYTVKINFSEEPGLSIYQNGINFLSILPEHFWAPVVEEARGSDDPKATLYAASGAGEPSAGTNVFDKWEQGAFASITANPDYYYEGTVYTTYADLSWSQRNGADIDETYFGSGSGTELSSYADGPFVGEIIYSEYGSQDAAYLAFSEGEVDYVLNPSGIPTGRREELRAIEGVEFAINPSEGFRYLAFNLRKAPMSDPAFRQAFAYVIDKEFVTGSVLGGAALPIYSLVPEANAAWYTDDVNKWGFGLSEGERFDTAVGILTDAGYTWSTNPEALKDEDGNYTGVFVDGEGMKTPDGTDVPEVELQTPGPGYDPLRSTFATWIGQWGERLGVPVDVNPTDFNTIVDATFPPQTEESVLEWDMYMLGWGGGDPSLPCTSHQAFFGADQDAVTGGGFNTPGYNDADFEALSDAFDAAKDLTTARTICADMETNISENLPYIVLFSTPITDAWRSNVVFPIEDVLGGINGFPNAWAGQVLVTE